MGETTLRRWSKLREQVRLSLPCLRAWVLFDIVLECGFSVWATDRTDKRVLGVALVALCEAVVSVHHVAAIGLGASLAAALCRTIAAAGPVVGTAALLCAAQ